MQRHLRLCRKDDFDHLRKNGQAWRHPLVILSVAPNTLTHNRYGFITGKRLGGAVVRNRIRRQLREIIRQAHPNLAQGYDLVFIAREAIVGQPYAVIQQVVITSLQKSGLWAATPGERSE
jgi:ribonuclease P protein component